MERLVVRFAARAARSAKKIALVTEKNQLTYDDLVHLVHVFDTRFRMAGVRPGASVLVTTSRPEFVLVMYLLASKISLHVIFSTPQAAEAAGVAYDHVLTDQPSVAAPQDRQIVVLKDWFDTLGTGTVPDITGLEGDGARITATTSGSTGVPKFIHGREDDNLGRSRPVLAGEFDARTRYLSTLSIRQRWTATTILSVLIEGGSAVALHEHRNRFLPYVDLYRVTDLQATPAIVRNMLDVPRIEEYLRSLDRIRVSGAFCATELLARLAEKCTAEIHSGYGASEIGGICSSSYDRSGQRPENYLGRMYRKDLEIAFFDDELEIIPGATEGVIGFRKIHGELGREYIDRQSDGAREKTGFVKGFFIPGDIIRRDGDDLYFLGRTKNIINHSGNKYALERIQAALEAAFPNGLIGCTVVTDAYRIEHLVVFYQSEIPLTAEGMSTVVSREIGPLKVARAVRLEEMPMTPTGKIDTADLRLRAKKMELN